MTEAVSRRGGFVPRRFTAVLCAIALLLQVGCHSYQPMQDAVPSRGQQVSLTLNDRGRVAVADRMGEGIDRVEGILVASSDTSATLQVTRTITIRRNQMTWAREEVQIPRDGIRGFQQQAFSGRRTAVLLLGVAAGFILVTKLIGLDVFGEGLGGGRCTWNCEPPIS